MTEEDVRKADEEMETTFDEDTNKVMMKNRRVTAMKTNRRIILPKELDKEREQDL